MTCIVDKYYQCEQQVADAIRDNCLTKELCLEFFRLSDCMFVHTEKVNTLARAAVRHRLAEMYSNEGHDDWAIEVLEDMIQELVKTTNRFGHDPDWDEYLVNVSTELCKIFRQKNDNGRVEIYTNIIEKTREVVTNRKRKSEHE